MKNKAFIGLDIGDRRIGIAASATGFLANGLETYTRINIAADAEHIASLARAYGAQTIVAGLPSHLDGGAHEQAAKNEILLKKLRELDFDERLTSVAAETYMLEADLSRKKRKQNIDKLAAQIILQNFLDANGGT